MEKQTVKKVTTMSFLGAALIAYVTVNTLFKTLAGAFGAVQGWYSVQYLNHGVPIGVALILFFVLQFNPGILGWAEEVVLEISKVVWPSRKDTVAMSIVVCIFVTVACVLLVLIDSVARELVHLIIQ